jgi:hypothetical protein
LALFAAGYFLGRGDLVFHTPRTDTQTFVGDGGAVQLRIDPNQPAIVNLLRSALTESMGFMALATDHALPYEMTLRMDIDRPASEVDMILALSLRRFAGLLEMRADPELWRWTPYQRVQSAKLEREGLWVVRSTMPLDEGALGLADERWAKPEGSALHPGREHGAEVVLDNRNGALYLVANTLLNPPLQAGDLPNEAPSAMPPEQLIAILGRVETARATLDVPDNDRVTITLRVNCVDEDMARGVQLLMLLVRDRVYLDLLEKDILLSGHLALEGRTISGEFTITGWRDRVLLSLGTAGI